MLVICVEFCFFMEYLFFVCVGGVVLVVLEKNIKGKKGGNVVMGKKILVVVKDLFLDVLRFDIWVGFIMDVKKYLDVDFFYVE